MSIFRIATLLLSFLLPIKVGAYSFKHSNPTSRNCFATKNRNLGIGIQQLKNRSIPTLCMTPDRDEDTGVGADKYSREVRLRAEAESPFQKVRFFLYIGLLGGAFSSLAVSGARIAAATLSGINTDLLPESIENAAIDLVGIITISFLYQRDLKAQESRMERASKGANLAKLRVRYNKDISNEKIILPLSSLRTGRGIEKRVVITIASEEKILKTLDEITNMSEGSLFSLGDKLEENDLVIVPVVLPGYKAPLKQIPAEYEVASIAFPYLSADDLLTDTNTWEKVLTKEMQDASDQGVDVLNDGICIILKKNGRVGQRTKGISLRKMVGEVQDRKEMGLDTKNI